MRIAMAYPGQKPEVAKAKQVQSFSAESVREWKEILCKTPGDCKGNICNCTLYSIEDGLYVYTRTIILLQYLVVVDIYDCLCKCIVICMSPLCYNMHCAIYRCFCINGAHAACKDSGGAVEVHETGEAV